MSTVKQDLEPDLIEYPEDNGEPMADNTLQFQWIVTIMGGLEAAFDDRPDVFVASDLLWYPVQGVRELCTAPDAMVVIGRPKGHRRSYLQWKEGGIPPQVVFEVLSHSNRPGRMDEKFRFYETHGVQEYYIYDPDDEVLAGWMRVQDRLTPIENVDDWTSPLLGVRFDMSTGGLQLYGPDGHAFQTFLQTIKEAKADRRRTETARRRAETERRRAETERHRAETRERQFEIQRERADAQERQLEIERERADAEHARVERLLSKLRELGIEPE